MALSVLSALARFDVDPWQETTSLARMPRERATERLAALIAATTIDFATGLSAATIAARLIALLPQAPSYKVPRSRGTAQSRRCHALAAPHSAERPHSLACRLLHFLRPSFAWNRPQRGSHDKRGLGATLDADNSEVEKVAPLWFEDEAASAAPQERGSTQSRRAGPPPQRPLRGCGDRQPKG